jgi:hypothetical protein
MEWNEMGFVGSLMWCDGANCQLLSPFLARVSSVQYKGFLQFLPTLGSFPQIIYPRLFNMNFSS